MTWKRVATAVVLIPLVVGLVLLGSTALVAIAMALVILLALFEFFALGDAIGHRAYRFWTATCALGLVYVQWLAARASSYELAAGLALHRETGRILGVLPTIADILFIFLMGVAALTLWTRRPLVESLPSAGISSSALILVALPLSFAIRLHGEDPDGPRLLLFALVITWAGDTTAYFVGRWTGKHPLARHLSPKKTWEGAVASLAAALIAAVTIFPTLAFGLYETVTSAGFPLWSLLTMAFVGNIAGQMGDLLESAFKRSAGVKDSGSLLPGHGGVLDRIDALILAFPVVWYYWTWIYLPNK